MNYKVTEYQCHHGNYYALLDATKHSLVSTVTLADSKFGFQTERKKKLIFIARAGYVSTELQNPKCYTKYVVNFAKIV